MRRSRFQESALNERCLSHQGPELRSERPRSGEAADVLGGLGPPLFARGRRCDWCIA